MPPKNSAELVSAAPFLMSYMAISGGQSQEFHFLGKPDTISFAPRSKDALHRHPHYEVVYVLDGEFVQHMENGVFRYQAGDACFLNRNVRHREGYESSCTLVFLNLQQEFLESLYAPVAIGSGRSQYTSGEIKRFIEENRSSDVGFEREYLDFAGTASRKQAADLPEASRILDCIAEEMTLGGTGYAFRVQALLLQFFQELENPQNYHLSRIRIDSNSEVFIYARLVRYLEERHGRATRQELGEILNYNGDYLNRIVKRQSGMTISQLGQRLCLQEAKRLLTGTSQSVSAIIEQLGFVNRTHFYRMFEESVGMSPKEYRRAVKE